MVARMSADSFAANGLVHIQPEGQTWQEECQHSFVEKSKSNIQAEDRSSLRLGFLIR